MNSIDGVQANTTSEVRSTVGSDRPYSEILRVLRCVISCHALSVVLYTCAILGHVCRTTEEYARKKSFFASRNPGPAILEETEPG